MKLKYSFFVAVYLNVLLVFLAVSAAQSQSYESYFLHIGDHPNYEEAGWHEEANGITHDADHWYITQAIEGGALWKIPVSRDLNSISVSTPGVIRKTYADYPQLLIAGYSGFGDMDYYQYNNTGYLIIGISGGAVPSAIAIFRSSDLSYVDHEPLPSQSAVKWCAVHPNGNIYTSERNASFLHVHNPNWYNISLNGSINLIFIEDKIIYNETGGSLLLHDVQGGVFTATGNLLYLVSGWYKDTDPIAEGIHVFDTQTWKRIQHSTNGHGYFNYSFIPGFPDYEEPEGITIWDLDDGRAPGILGQLHVMMLDNDAPDDDDTSLKHYTNVISVDGAYSGTELGTSFQPFNSVTEAYNFAWSGATLKIKAGSYSESITFNKQLQVLSSGGTVIIGNVQ